MFSDISVAIHSFILSIGQYYLRNCYPFFGPCGGLAGLGQFIGYTDKCINSLSALSKVLFLATYMTKFSGIWLCISYILLHAMVG